MLQMTWLRLQRDITAVPHLGTLVLVALSRPVSNHLGSCGLEGCVYLIHSVTEILAVANSITQAKDSNRLAFEIKA